MEALVKQVAERSGISEGEARTAVETVVGFLKERLPESLAGQIDGLLSSDQAANVAGDLAAKIGGFFSGGAE